MGLSLLALAAAVILSGCGSASGPATRSVPPRSFALEQVAGSGDATRRASVRLVLDALEQDAAADPAGAALLYERALQLDPTNPYAFLAYARHLLEDGDPDRALAFLDKAEALLAPAPQPLRAHLAGLRGAAYRDGGDGGDAARAAPLLEEAARLDPAAWEDGSLSAEELR